MRHLLLPSAGILSLLFLTIPVFAQPDTNYVPGTQVCWTFNNRPHGYFKAVSHTIVSPAALTVRPSQLQGFDKRTPSPLLYPNPARNEVTINTNGLFADAYSIQVIDASGRVQKRISNIRNRNYQLDVSTLQKGIYILLIKTGSYRVQQKLLVE